MNGNYRVGDTVLGEWKLTKLLGQGSYGKVFEGEREDFGVIYKAAIKIITIPQNESEIQSTRAEGLDDASITAYFRSMVEEMVKEFALMSKLKGKLEARYKENKALKLEFVPEPEEEDFEDEMVIVRRKHVELSPMVAEEAVLQMEMLGHDFFVFLDMDTDAVSVVYRRKGDAYGLIETDR